MADTYVPSSAVYQVISARPCKPGLGPAWPGMARQPKAMFQFLRFYAALGTAQLRSAQLSIARQTKAMFQFLHFRAELGVAQQGSAQRGSALQTNAMFQFLQCSRRSDA